MRYLENERRLEIGAEELVYFGRLERAISFSYEESGVGYPATEARRFCLTGQKERETLYYDHPMGEYCLAIQAQVDAIDDVTLHFIRPVTVAPDRADADTVAQTRGEAYCAGHIFACVTGRTPRLRLIYDNPDFPAPYIVEEEPTKQALEAFFHRLLASAECHAAPELDRVTRRLPTLKNARFPFPEIRWGQRELMEHCYTTIRRHGKLYACAPTGTGKTMSVLYPAVRAVGEGLCDKVFYLTPKNTTAMAVAHALTHLQRSGAEVRGMILTAKEKICPASLVCREGVACGLSPRAQGREDRAARELLSRGLAVVGEEEISEVAGKYRVCPYELSLRYSMYCDVICGDYNYLFDLRASLRRYFDRGGRYAFLVDEAHNLVERARELYSTAFTKRDLDDLARLTEPVPHMREAVSTFRAYFDRLMRDTLRDETYLGADGRSHGFASTEDLSAEMYTNVCNLAYALSDLPRGSLPDALMRELRPVGYDWLHNLEKLALYDGKFRTFYERDGEDYRFRTVCTDPSDAISLRLCRGESAVFFSATLTPTDYYRDVLGGDRTSTLLEVPSPFERDHLCVAVMDRISTRYQSRENTVREVVRAILTAVRAKPGNYMVFCPSYAYMTSVVKAVQNALPKLPILVQKREMSAAEREEFLRAFDANPKSALVGFCVMGGIYSEGIDLVGKRLIGAVIVGVGLPNLSNDREAIRAHFDSTADLGREYAYVYPGMNRVLQAAGRVIRTENDRGVVLLIDDRFATPEYKRLMPAHWHGLRFVGDVPSLENLLSSFWKKGEN